MQENAPTHCSKNYLITALFACAIILTSIQVVTPLRLNTDAVRLLLMANFAFQCDGFLLSGTTDQFPPGYPTLVLFLMHAGLANSHVFVLINVLSLIISLLLLKRLTPHSQLNLPAGTTWLLLSLLTLCSWCTIKHVTIALTEFPFMMTSMLALAALQRAIESDKPNNRAAMWATASMFVLLSITLRTIGLALLPTLFFAFLMKEQFFQTLHQKFKAQAVSNKKQILFTGLFLMAAAMLFFSIAGSTWFHTQFLQDNSYLKAQLQIFFQKGILAAMAEISLFRLQEMGELLLNMPRSMHLLPEGMFLAAGIIGWGAIICGGFLLFKKHAPITLYLFFYILIMIFWPYQDCRFWIPVTPLLTLCLVQSAGALLNTDFGKYSFLRMSLTICLCLYLSLGFSALIYSTRISFSGDHFIALYGGGTLKETYILANKPIPLSAIPAPLQKNVQVLRIFGNNPGT